MVKAEKKPYGYIYVATNRLNGKVYVGQTITSRWRDDKIPIEERWNKEIQDAERIFLQNKSKWFFKNYPKEILELERKFDELREEVSARQRVLSFDF